MSQCTPIIADVTPRTESHMYHGILLMRGLLPS
jgi:hypothetical protein